MVLLIDNYDSFSYNLYQLIGEFNQDIKVIRNDEMTVEEIEKLNPSHIIISPGAGKPCDTKVCIDVIKQLYTKIPILGVCLGHQTICEVFGMTVSFAKRLMHGKQSVISIVNKGVFAGLDTEISVARYHSLSADASTLTDELEVLGTSDDGEIMAVQVKGYPVYGVQFHPESILTSDGKTMMKNFLGYEWSIKEIVKNSIVKVTKKEDLTFDEAKIVMNEIMLGTVTPVQVSAYLVALSMKGETIEEITGSAKAMRNHAAKLDHSYKGDILEIVGTGGDHSNSFNISTTCAIVLAGAGVTIGKHGNRAASSKCGSADVLEALGVKIDINPSKSAELLEKNGICFLFAPVYHSAMKYVAPVRKELGVRTIFNILGPLTNPLGANIQLMGVYDPSLIDKLANVLVNLGVKSGMVVYGTDGLDEISMSAVTQVCEIRDGKLTNYTLDPREYGFNLCDKSALEGGMPNENADITRKILQGEKSPCRDAVVINSAAALYLSRDDITLKDAITEIEKVLDSGKALDKLDEWIKLSNVSKVQRE